MQGFVNGPGCSVDGTASGVNPLGRVVDQFLGIGGNSANGRMVGPRGPVGAGPSGIRAGMQSQYHAQQMQSRGVAPRGPPSVQGMNDVWMARQRPGGDAGGGAAAMNRSFRAANAASTTAHANAAWAAARAGKQMHGATPHAPQVLQQPGPMMGAPMMRGPGIGPAMMGSMGMSPMMMGGMGMNSMMMGGMAPSHQYHSAPQMHPATATMSHPITSAAAYRQHTQQSQGPIIEEVVDSQVAKEETANVTKKADNDMSETRAMTREMVRVLSQDPKFKDSEFLGFMDQISRGEVEFAGNKVRPGDAKSMEDAAREAETEASAATTKSAAVETANATKPSSTLEERLADAWKESMAGNEVDLDAIWEEALADGQVNFDNFGPMFGGQLNNDMMSPGMIGEQTKTPEYQLPQDNKYRGQKELFSKGMQLFNNGEIKEAIEAFQAFVEGETDDPSEGWRMLGLSHQEHDEDRKAILCLERAVEEDPYNLDALLALGVSYVNELNSESALKTLKLWVEHNPSFQGMKVEVDAYSDGSLMDEVMQLMVAAQRAAAANGGDDTDVQVVLGVLYNVSRDYDSAVNAFKSAVQTRPGDYSLWNKLGATLANGSRSEQAIPAYHKALELKPKYARGRLNLGISHANLQNYAAAARAYLDALRLNPDASHIWSYLRIAFTCMERFDLVQMVSICMIVEFCRIYDFVHEHLLHSDTYSSTS